MIYEVWRGKDIYEFRRDGMPSITQQLVFCTEDKIKAVEYLEKEKNRAKWQSREPKNKKFRFFTYIIEIDSNKKLSGDNGCYSKTIYEKSYSIDHANECVNTIDAVNEIFENEDYNLLFKQAN